MYFQIFQERNGSNLFKKQVRRNRLEHFQLKKVREMCKLLAAVCYTQFSFIPTEMLKKDRERAKKLHPVIRDDIRRYNVRDLDKVQTEVKQWMPSAQG